MAFIDTISPEQADEALQAMYDRQAGAFGYLPNYARVFCYRPELMVLWAELQRGIRRHVEPRRYELITLAAARALRSSYCCLAHGQVLTEILSAEDVRAIAIEAPSSISAAEEAMMAFAARIARDAASVTCEDVDVLKAHGFSDAEIFDIAISAAARSFFTKVVDGLGALPDAAFQAMPDQLREVLTVGRPIETSESGTA